MLTEKIKRRKLCDQVVDRMIERIGAGEFPPGSLLPSERALMAAFGTGRPAVREAFHSLQRMGLIAIRHGEGARVQALTPERVITQVADIAHFLMGTTPGLLDHLKSSRLRFEVAMARDAATLASDNDIGELRSALGAQASADKAASLEKDMAFHQKIIAISRNPIFAGLGQLMFELLEHFYVLRPSASGRRVAQSEHRRILDRISARDAEGADREMTAHLTRALKHYKRRVERRRSS